MGEWQYQKVVNGDVTLNVVAQGSGPLVVFVHGWPELSYSWRHQMAYFAKRGYTAAALDVRGYGDSSAPFEVAEYTLRKICGDVAAVIDTFDSGPAIVVGHDWGAPIAWNTARFHTDRVKAVAGLSVPYHPVTPVSALALWKTMFTDEGKFFYQVYFLEEGVAEAELGADSLASLRKIYYAASGDALGADFVRDKPADSKMLDGLIDPDPFPEWATEEDLATYAAAFDKSGWRGPLNRYRAQTLDAEELGSLPDPNIGQPAAFIGGEHDVVRQFVEGFDPFETAGENCDDFRGTTIIPGAGHWVQQEAPAATNEALEAFFDSL
ncbi:MAG: alpha/beta hydrolase [Actinomycetia bacterium]|nr:alpha/beta hydrolase [Actinomycetes bacterium]